MLIRSLTLENFGLFRGRNILDFTPKTRYGTTKPVILVGGKNGAGKTTILEAIRLCLYGPLALGNRTTTRQYEEYLCGCVHRDEAALINPESATVALEFEHAEHGNRHVYRVERSWDSAKTGGQMTLAVQRDGKPLDELDQAHADDFLRDLIPPGVSQLYFFDGEKIQQLAETDHDEVTLAEAIRGLLGLDLVERLRGDLRVYASRLGESLGAEPIKAELSALESERAEYVRQQFEVQRKVDEAGSCADSFRQEIARAEQRLAREGGAFASQRETLKAEREQLLKLISDVENELRELAEGLLPFLLVSSWCRKLRDQLVSEEKLQGWLAHEKLLSHRIDELKVSLADRLFPDKATVSIKARESVVQRAEQILDELVSPPDDLPQINVIHRLSDDQRQRLLGGIDRALNDLPLQLKSAESRLELATRRLQEVDGALAKVPSEDQLHPLLERLHVLNRELGAAQAEAERHQADLNSIDVALKEVERKEVRLQEKIVGAEKGLDRRVIVARVRSVLDEYAQALTTAKSIELSEAVARRFGQLWRKGDVVRRIEIDPVTFQVTLFDRHDRSVPKKRLSAGERQVYAISMLWALAQVSGRALPMVIDTPLGRLDSDHRAHLVTRYFPHASHQVLILSTDTEIDQTYFRELSSSVSHAYHLRYDGREARTIIEEGYFWGRREMELAHAD
jgi:DNA sulfur modification protein DndD